MWTDNILDFDGNIFCHLYESSEGTHWNGLNTKWLVVYVNLEEDHADPRKSFATHKEAVEFAELILKNWKVEPLLDLMQHWEVLDFQPYPDYIYMYPETLTAESDSLNSTESF